MSQNKENNRIVNRDISTEMRESYIGLRYVCYRFPRLARCPGRTQAGAQENFVHYASSFYSDSLGEIFEVYAIVGDALGKYHPHGDVSVYDAMVRMAQDFLMRYPLVDGQGNWGSIDGDSAAAMRYTEARMTSIAEQMLSDIQKETVDFKPNYDNRLMEPSVLLPPFPNCL